MKKFVLMMVLMAGGNAFAAKGPLICERGEPGYDDHQVIEIHKSKLEIGLYETFLSVPASKYTKLGSGYSIHKQRIEGASEGIDFVATVNAMIIVSSDSKVAVATLIIDGDVILDADVLKCRRE